MHVLGRKTQILPNGIPHSHLENVADISDQNILGVLASDHNRFVEIDNLTRRATVRVQNILDCITILKRLGINVD